MVYIVSKGGLSAELNQFARIARDRGATLIAQTEKPESPLGKLSDLVFKVVAPAEVDPYGMIATGSSLVNSLAGDVLCVILLKLGGYTRDQFGATHPGGAVGKRLASDGKQGACSD
jgi:arabinose-5-phosphate isomerase